MNRFHRFRDEVTPVVEVMYLKGKLLYKLIAWVASIGGIGGLVTGFFLRPVYGWTFFIWGISIAIVTSVIASIFSVAWYKSAGGHIKLGDVRFDTVSRWFYITVTSKSPVPVRPRLFMLGVAGEDGITHAARWSSFQIALPQHNRSYGPKLDVEGSSVAVALFRYSNEVFAGRHALMLTMPDTTLCPVVPPGTNEAIIVTLAADCGGPTKGNVERASFRFSPRHDSPEFDVARVAPRRP